MTIATKQYAENIDFSNLDSHIGDEVMNAIELTHAIFPHFPKLNIVGSYSGYKNLTKARRQMIVGVMCVIFENDGRYDILINDKTFSHQTVAAVFSRINEQAPLFNPQGCRSISGCAFHEIGHILDKLVAVSKDKIIRRIFRQFHNKQDSSVMANALSGYANTTTSEFIAEAWSEYMANPTPRELATKVALRVIELYQAKYNDFSENAYNNFKTQQLSKQAKSLSTKTNPEPKQETTNEAAELALKIMNDFTNGHPTLFNGKEYRDFIKEHMTLKELRDLARKFYIPLHTKDTKVLLANWITKQIVAFAAHRLNVIEAPDFFQHHELMQAQKAQNTTIETTQEPKNNTSLTIEAINACETREEIYDILITAKKKELIEFVKLFGIYVEAYKGLKALQKIARYCAAKILIIREHEQQQKQQKQEPPTCIYIDPVVYVDKHQQICIDFEATNRKAIATILQGKLVNPR